MSARTTAAFLLMAPLLAVQPQGRVQRFSLSNGLPVLLLEDHERPLVRIRLQIPLAPADTPGGHPGLPALVLRMMAHADAGDLKAEDLERALESAGIDWTQAVTSEGLVWNLVARSRDQDRAMGLLAHRVTRTLLDRGDLELQRLAAWREEDGGGQTPRTRLRRALEPEATLRPPALGSLSTLSFEDLQAFQTRVLRPDRAVLLLHGDLGLEQAKRLALLSLGTWSTPSLPTAPSVPAQAAPAPSPVFIPAPGAPLRLQAVAAAPADLPPEAQALLACLLPGDPAPDPARITLEGSRLVITLDEGAVAWSDLLGRLEALRKRGFSETDLSRARRAWAAGRSLADLHPGAQMDEALRAFQGHSADPALVESLGLDALNQALRRWLAPANLRLGAAGDPAALKELAKP